MKNFYLFVVTRRFLVSITAFLCVFSLYAQTVTVPAANTNNGSINDPLGTYWGFERSAMIYTSAQIGTTGTITSVGFYVNSVATPGAAVNVRIYMKMRTTLFTAISTYATETTGATLVYGPTTIPAASFVAGNWITIPLTTAFSYTGGTNNLEVIIETNATGTGNEGTATSKQFRYTTQASNQFYQNWNQDNAAPTGNGTRAGTRPNIQLNFVQPDYKTQLVSMNTGSVNWCAGETRNVSITLQNTGTQSWTDVPGVDFNVGVKWNADPDYLIRVDAQNLAPGASTTYTFTVTAPMTVGTNNLSFDVVREGCFWFANNSTACGVTAGPGNIVFVSSAQNIKPLPVVNAGVDDTICGSETAQLNGSATVPPAFLPGSATFNYSGSGYDWSYFLIGGTTSGMPAGSIITGITFTATIGPDCGDWYEWDFGVNSTYVGSGCDGTYTYTGLNGQPANGQLLQLQSYDLDDWPDPVTMTFIVIVNYSPPIVPLTYVWSGLPVVSNTGILNPTTNTPITTNYTLTATADGCSASDMVTIVVDDCSPLPVVLSAFSASCENNNVVVSWATESQQNCDYFRVETSRDGQTWEEIAHVLGAGNSTSHLDYAIVDENAISGVSYYRLKQVDYDGMTKLYGPISLNCESSDGDFLLFPNPATRSFTIQVQADYPEEATVIMTDATGKIMLQKPWFIKKGSNQFPVENLTCGSGVYFVSILKDDGSSEMLRIVIQ